MNKPNITQGEWQEIGYCMVSSDEFGAIADCEFLDLRGEKYNSINAQAISALPNMMQELIVSTEIMELCIAFMKEQDLSHESILNQIENNKKALKKAGCTD